MSGYRFSFPACLIAGKCRIDADDVLRLRRYTFPEGIGSFDDALTLLALNDHCPEHSPEWVAYFVESLTMFLVHGCVPRGVVDEAKAGWLMRSIADDCVVRSPAELELLLHVIEVAPEAPESLSAFTLDQIRLALQADARGAYHAIRPASPGIAAHDLAYIWRVLRSAVERGRLVLSPLEVVVLREIDGLASASAHHPAWREMIDAIVTLDRPRHALRSAPWLVTNDVHPSSEELAA
ncbi:hypothetical protein EDE05_12246 [Neorhizobium sp. R1-B]|uniref:hypothetical protein n=1 Tax=unclassified Neorhizobium TaxID=2629175 RepID=UPI001052E2BF|nr:MULTISPECIES: hypothetical protein [unclassified Neorhizobium]TCV61325.1 hypothetical protein EDE09_12646 [Neorhizobium sp. S3-V5DH]TDX74220.1 hypothetical protein EDE05_12246 [Neorhizobium sp. R1-B]